MINLGFPVGVLLVTGLAYCLKGCSWRVLSAACSMAGLPAVGLAAMQFLDAGALRRRGRRTGCVACVFCVTMGARGRLVGAAPSLCDPQAPFEGNNNNNNNFKKGVRENVLHTHNDGDNNINYIYIIYI